MSLRMRRRRACVILVDSGSESAAAAPSAMRKGFVRPLRLSEHLSNTSPERSRAIGIWFEKLVRLDAMISREAHFESARRLRGRGSARQQTRPVYSTAVVLYRRLQACTAPRRARSPRGRQNCSTASSAVQGASCSRDASRPRQSSTPNPTIDKRRHDGRGGGLRRL